LQENFYVITNESAVPLEAIYNGNLLYKAGFLSKKKLDNYGFLKKKLILVDHDNISSLMSSIKTKEIEFDKGKLDWFIGSTRNIEVVLSKTLNEIFSNI
jgi:hypothetical protein